MLVAFAVALVWTAFIARPHVEGFSSLLDRFEEVCLDLRYALAPTKHVPPDVVLVALDDETLRRAGAFPLPRPALTSLVEAIARQKPRAIALDMLFLDPGRSDIDAAFSRTLQSQPTVIAAAGLFNDGPTAGAISPLNDASALPKPTRILWPIDPMAQAAEVGLVNLATGYGGTPRHMPLLFRGDTGVVPSFVLLAVALASGKTPRFDGDGVAFGDRRVALDLGQTMALRFYGPRGAVPTVSAAAIGGPNAPDLAGRIVVVGSTAVGGGDTFPTSFSSVVPGAEILATAIDNLLAGDALVRSRLTRWLDAGVAGVLAVAAVVLLTLRRVLLGLALVALLGVVWVALTVAAFSHGYWLSTALPIAAMVPVAALYGSARLLQERGSALRLAEVERGLRPFQPRPMSDLLSRDPLFLVKPEVQDAAVLFVDLAGYTTLSESHDPVRMRDLLKSFHARVDEVVDRRGGFVVTFMGDGAMALFGFPEPGPEDALRALSAVSELETSLLDWGHPNSTGMDSHIDARLSAHYGPVVVSRLGGASHEQITATGDTVNVASRLLEVAKANKVSTVVSERIFQAAEHGAPTAHFPRSIEVAIRGRDHPVIVRLSERKRLPTRLS